LDIDAFDFVLPKHLIAQKSVYPADKSRMLFISDNVIKDHTTMDLAKLLKPGDLIVVNNTKVINSRIIGLLKLKTLPITMLDESSEGVWEALVKGSKKLKVGDKVKLPNNICINVKKKGERGLIYFDVHMSKLEFIEYLNLNGELPLPPYIKVNDTNQSEINYQTLFAKNYGAVAAPTAGLHFTENLKNNLCNNKIDIVEITLHVGSGTFLPVEVSDISKHIMHNEFYQIDKDTADKINKTKAAGGRVIAVGTTVLRALESSIKGDKIQPYSGNTNIFISPGYKVRSSDYLLTNFHLPKSTLFILTCAYAGIEKMHDAYKHAIEEGYRFYSLGDACLIKKANQ
tara:strand:+ start:540 stop:1568 length:1029 start_codon:yes stop_codon:yes gene_type:complete